MSAGAVSSCDCRKTCCSREGGAHAPGTGEGGAHAPGTEGVGVGHMLQVQKGWGWAHAPGIGEGAGDIKRHERSGHNATALMNTLCMHTEEWLSHAP